LLEKLRAKPGVEVHLILSRGGERTLFLETGKRAADLKDLAHAWHSPEDIGAAIASGSSVPDAMVVAPCSINTLSAIAHGISSNLVVRAADVVLKERRKLVLMVRETPFHLGHIRSMAAVTEMGAIVCPPIPGFYHKPQTILDLVDHSVDRVLDLVGLPEPGAARWNPEAGK
jgi:4-hydroxy-3-polyprenylbenzoate decarboxylase